MPDTLKNLAASHSRKTLASRGGLARTFGGLVIFVSVTLLVSGIYLIQDSLAHPLAADPQALLFAALLLAIAVVLLFYVTGSRRKRHTRRRHRKTRQVGSKDGAISIAGF